MLNASASDRELAECLTFAGSPLRLHFRRVVQYDDIRGDWPPGSMRRSIGNTSTREWYCHIGYFILWLFE